MPHHNLRHTLSEAERQQALLKVVSSPGATPADGERRRAAGGAALHTGPTLLLPSCTRPEDPPAAPPPPQLAQARSAS